MSGPRDQVRKRLEAFRSQQLLKAVQSALYEAADLVRSEAFRSISAGSVSGKKHKPSAPGQPPNRDCGVLQANIEVIRQGFQPGKELVATVESSAPYSTPLEFGTSTMEARPFLRPARDKMKPRAERLLVTRVNQAIKRYRK